MNHPRVIPVAYPGFPRGVGANSTGGANIRFCQIFPKNCMKLKEFGPPGGCASLVPPFYHLQTKFAKVMFLQVSVCPKGVCMAGGMYGRGVCMVRGVCGGGHAWQGVCVRWGMHGRGCAW